VRIDESIERFDNIRTGTCYSVFNLVTFYTRVITDWNKTFTFYETIRENGNRVANSTNFALFKLSHKYLSTAPTISVLLININPIIEIESLIKKKKTCGRMSIWLCRSVELFCCLWRVLEFDKTPTARRVSGWPHKCLIAVKCKLVITTLKPMWLIKTPTQVL
jgi:hypothetical protein